MRIWTLALVVGVSALVAGCGEEKKDSPKAPAGADLKPLNAPSAPGGAPTPKKAPGGTPTAQ